MSTVWNEARAAAVRRRSIARAVAPRAMGAAVALLAGGLASCAAVGPGSGAPEPAIVYVANSSEGTITRLDGATGRAIAPPLPAGPTPGQLVVSADGSLLAVPVGPAHSRGLTYVSRADGAWAARRIPVEADTYAPLAAGDGGRYAAVAYYVTRGGGEASRSPCRVALMDLRTGTMRPGHAVCAAGDHITGVALESSGAGPTAYLAIWRSPEQSEAGWVAGGGRVVTLDLETGATLGVAPLAGIPGRLILAPAPGRTGRRLYGALAVPSPGGDPYPYDYGRQYAAAERWSLLALNPATLGWESELPLAHSPEWLVVTPDGHHAYAMAGPARASGSILLHVDLRTGSTRRLARLPLLGLGGLAIAGERIYVPNPERSEVWVVDRRTGAVVKTVPTGRNPLGITTSATA